MTGAVEVEKAAILVIDDDPLLLKTITKILEREGYFVDCAQDGYEGIRKAKAGYFHLILCDIKMPGLDGIMTLGRIKEYQAKAKQTSGFIVITAFDTEDTRKKAFHLGVTDYLTKPFDLKDFITKIHHNVDPLVKPTHDPLTEIEKLTHRLKGFLDA